MAFIEYRDHEERPSYCTSLKALADYSVATRGILSMLGDYWTSYYRDTEAMSLAASGAIASAGREINELLSFALAGNISDAPAVFGRQFELLAFRRSDIDENGFISIPELQDVEYLCSELFEPKVVLVKNKHFTVQPGEGITFLVDIFNDPAIMPYEYQTAEKTALFWASPVILETQYIFERFGRFLYKRAADGNRYKWYVASLMRYYTHAKTAFNISTVMDVLYGIPYTRYANEVIQSVTFADSELNDWPNAETTGEAPYLRVVTDKNTYYTFAFSKLRYNVGDTVPQFSTLSSLTDVIDYINHPKWWLDSSIGYPDGLFSAEAAATLTEEQKSELLDKVLKYNTVYIRLNITYENFELYRLLVNQLFEIIKSGFPVYLYPFVEVAFGTVFVDDYHMYERIIEMFRALVRYTTSDTWNWWWKRYDAGLTYGADDETGEWKELTEGWYCYNEKLLETGRANYGLNPDAKDLCGRYYGWSARDMPDPDAILLSISTAFFEPKVRYVLTHNGVGQTDSEWNYSALGELFAYDKSLDLLIPYTLADRTTFSDYPHPVKVRLTLKDVCSYMHSHVRENEAFDTSGTTLGSAYKLLQTAREVFALNMALNLRDRRVRMREYFAVLDAELVFAEDKIQPSEKFLEVANLTDFTERKRLNWPRYSGAIYYGKALGYHGHPGAHRDRHGNVWFTHDAQNDILELNPYAVTFEHADMATFWDLPVKLRDRLLDAETTLDMAESKFQLNFPYYNGSFSHGGTPVMQAPRPGYIKNGDGTVSYRYSELSEKFSVVIRRENSE